jgi:DNA-binding HxlR family transcriptional regulator
LRRRTVPPRVRRLAISALPPPKRHPYNQWAPDARALDLVGDKWTLLIVRDLAGGPRRFVELQRVLPGISTEQLRSRLNRMVADGLLTRQRYREVPPRVDYELTERARDLLPVVAALGQWGYKWAWGPPRPGEAIDVGAILRCLPGIELPSSLRGTVELIVTRGPEAEGFYVLHLGDGTCSYEERSAPEADARVAGPERAWIEAFGIDGSRTELEVSGDMRLAEAFLDAVVAGSFRTRVVAWAHLKPRARRSGRRGRAPAARPSRRPLDVRISNGAPAGNLRRRGPAARPRRHPRRARPSPARARRARRSRVTAPRPRRARRGGTARRSPRPRRAGR